MKKKEIKNKGEVKIYQTSKKEVSFEVRLEKETVWLDAHQMARVFDVDRTGVVRHINNIYKTGELERNSTCAKIAQVAADGRVRKMDTYNLDMVLSVGYRVNSKQATQFRVWATKTLKQHLLDGYTINKKRLQEANNKFTELQEAVAFLRKNLWINPVY